MGSRARSYLRLEVVGGGRRAAEGSAGGEVNAVETWYSRGARHGAERSVGEITTKSVAESPALPRRKI